MGKKVSPRFQGVKQYFPNAWRAFSDPSSRRVEQPVSYLRNITALIMVSGFFVACGEPGQTESASCGLCGDFNDITGSIRSKTGSQSAMTAWVMASFEHDTSIARVAEVDNAGLYTLRQVNTDDSQTLALFTPDYILTAVLSIKGAQEKTINQFIRFDRQNLPLLINNGPIIEFQDFNGLKIERDLAADADGDGIPDGSVSLGASSVTAAGLHLQGTATPQPIDTDADGVLNANDPDIDGDGIINVLDPDDNGNGILDVFDGDANGDLMNDTQPGANNTDLYFKQGVEYIAVQFNMAPKEDGSGLATTLKFTTKVRDEVTPDVVQIRGAPSLLNGSTYNAKDSTGAVSVQAWNRQLFDDGASDDGSPGDRLFAKSIDLAAAKTPRAHEAVFFQLGFNTTTNPYFIEFPYIFPDLKPSAVTSAYEKNSRMVLLLGNPFGPDVQDFIWLINVFDSNNVNVWQSQSIPASNRQFPIQENIMVTGQTYKYSVTAATLDKIPGYPAYTISSIKYDVK